MPDCWPLGLLVACWLGAVVKVTRLQRRGGDGRPIVAIALESGFVLAATLAVIVVAAYAMLGWFRITAGL